MYLWILIVLTFDIYISLYVQKAKAIVKMRNQIKEDLKSNSSCRMYLMYRCMHSNSDFRSKLVHMISPWIIARMFGEMQWALLMTSIHKDNIDTPVEWSVAVLMDHPIYTFDYLLFIRKRFNENNHQWNFQTYGLSNQTSQ